MYFSKYPTQCPSILMVYIEIVVIASLRKSITVIIRAVLDDTGTDCIASPSLGKEITSRHHPPVL